MLSVQNDTYRTTTGGIIVAGKSVQNGVWTPPKDSTGKIPLEAYADLTKPALKNKWSLVAGSIPNAILERCFQKYGFRMEIGNRQLGNDKSGAAIFNAWSAPIVDYENYRMFWYATGGHENSSWNAIVVLDLRTFTWDILVPPSWGFDPNSPATNWSTYYVNKVTETGVPSATYTSYKPAPPAGSVEDQYGAYEILPDGRPTSAHTYGDGVYDPVNNRILRLKGRRWDYDLNTGQERMHYYRNTATNQYWATGTGGYSFLDKVNRRVWGNFPKGANTFLYMNVESPGASGTEAPVTPVGGWFQNAYNAGCLMNDGQRILQVAGVGSVLRGNIFNMAEAHTAIQAGQTGTQIRDAATHTWATGPGGVAEITNAYADLGDFPGLAYINDWNQAVFLATKDAQTNNPSWQLLDIGTQSATRWTPAGNAPPLESGMVYGGNLHYIPGLKMLMLIMMNRPSLPSIYVMGVGPK